MSHAHKKQQKIWRIFVVFIFVLQLFSPVIPATETAQAIAFDPGSGYCGDGIKNGAEECDDGNFIDDDACHNDCTWSAICTFELDVALVLDRSGSMGDSSRCDWWKLECANKPSCTSYIWKQYTTFNQSESWCDLRDQSAPHESSWVGYDPVKIVAAKDTAHNFLAMLGGADQSALVSFATDVTLDKQLSSDHAATQAALDSLAAYGATNIGDAISEANAELTSGRANPGAEQIMILLTDGMANKPYGPGYGEYPADVAYALAQADNSALYDIKIFTIGLGTDINAVMLEQIADKTDGQYYFAPTAAELEDIFTRIADDICRFGSIHGCKYEDGNRNGVIDPGEFKISDWEITLENEAGEIFTRWTDNDGCFHFNGMPLGEYTLSEGAKPGVIFNQTYPGSGDYVIDLGEEDLLGYDFANYIPNCGNGIADTGYLGYEDEECDDGNDINTDSCTNECRLPYCGDGFVSLGEECDDANQSNTDGCLNNCTAPFCGDGYIWAGEEECDDNGLNGQICVPAYGSDCTYCSALCAPVTLTGPYCGDGIKNGPEECDGLAGVTDHYTCTANCLLEYVPYCGDGLVNQPSEQCDDGNLDNDDGCLNTCLFASCGDGLVNQSFEQCDDGNSINTDECTNSCKLPFCGDGIVSLAEECDDTNNIDTDDCRNDCTMAVCGDGIIWAGHELCDDNGLNGQVCTPDYGDTCSYCSDVCEPVELTGPYCGDGIKNGPEACDGADGLGPHESCTAECAVEILPYCGDGIVNQPGEECDDGNDVNDDFCQNDCNYPPMCEFPLDVALVMDRSGSMGDSSRCDWWQLKCKNRPSCSLGYEWVLNTTYNQTESWCQARNQSAPHNSTWIDYTPIKMTANKAIAHNFLNALSSGDQSALVSFASDATLDKLLSNDHALTQAEVDSLVTYGATNIGDAIKLGLGELTSPRINPAAEQIMILFTDGKANKPSGPGYGEYGPDVVYALNEASQAAAAGIKIYTIGIDSEINAVMLAQIADMTGGEYYFAPTAAELDDVYTMIWPDICAGGPYCGDGIMNNAEECDGADGVGPNQTCSDVCTLVSNEYCGDGIMNASEECDGTDGVGEHQSCSAECLLVDEPYCGDGMMNGAEECDGIDGVPEHYVCEIDCTLTYIPYCGDGIINQPAEECDDGNLIENDGCNSSCLRVTSPVSYCGDGVIDPGEECDDNGLNGQPCVPVYGSSCDYCSGGCQTISVMGQYCGDGTMNGPEDCDDGNSDDGDACHNDCTLPVYPVCTDLDVDGYGTGEERSACAYPELDCDDSDANINPGATEVCADGLDNDCDGDIDGADADCASVGPGPGDVVINELMWMGTSLSSADEWIELYNTTDSEIDLSSWQITRNDGGAEELMLTIPGGKTIPAHGYFLISNYNKANSKIDVDPDYVTTAVTLAGTALQIKIYQGDWANAANLVDTADDASGAPLAGDSANKYSMSRTSPAGDGTLPGNWFTAITQVNWDAGAAELGTPKAAN